MDRLSLLNYGLRCTGLREESSIVLFGKVVKLGLHYDISISISINISCVNRE